MKTAIIHDWLLGMRGGEKVLEAVCELYPAADIYTLLHRPERLSDLLRGKNVRASWFQTLPWVDHYYRYLLPLMPQAIGRLDASGCDLVISSSHCVAKGVSLGGNTVGQRPLHICYCHSPMRYIYDQFDNYFSQDSSSLGLLTRKAAAAFRSYLAAWDKQSSRQVDHFIANSENVKRRIEKHYEREAAVIYPPVDVDFYTPKEGAQGSYYLIAGALVPYKRVDLAIAACRHLKAPLKIVGVGSEENWLRRLAAGADVEFLGWQSQQTLRGWYQNCAALLFPQEEDFGIAAAEAMACGKPVIAYKAGGAMETVVEGKTGVFFTEQTASALASAITQARSMRFEPAAIREQTLRFDGKIFKSRFGEFIQKALGGKEAALA